MSFGYSYILVRVDYVSKWVEAIPCKCNDHRVVLKFLKENIFSRFRVPKAIISDGGTHFCNKSFKTLLAKYEVKHKVATPYHPQTSGQVELANREIKKILMKVVNTSIRYWSIKLHDSLPFSGTRLDSTLLRYSPRFYISPYSPKPFFGTRPDSTLSGTRPDSTLLRYSIGFYRSPTLAWILPFSGTRLDSTFLVLA